MSVDIKLNLIKPSKDLRLACMGYNYISRAISYSRKYNLGDLLDLIFFVNKKYYPLISNQINYRNLIDSIIAKKKITKKQKDNLNLLKKLFPIVINKKSEDYFNDILIEFKEKEFIKVSKYLEQIYTSTKSDITLFCVNNSRNGFGGSATNTSFHISISDNLDYKEYTYNRLFVLFFHEIIHVINLNNEIYTKIEKYVLDKYGKIKSNSFSETFTSTIENIIAYKLGYNNKKYYRYRYIDKEDCILEDNIRKLYDSWEKTKGNNKEKFIVYLEKNIKKI
jgi:hypothetical protein